MTAKRKMWVCSAALFVAFLTAPAGMRAQGIVWTGTDALREHSIEVNVGYPSVVSILETDNLSKNFGSQGIYRYYEDRETGSDVRQLPNFSIAFRWGGLNRRTDFLLMASIGLNSHQASHYTSWNEDGHFQEGGYWSGLRQDRRRTNIGDASVTALWRFNWACFPGCHLYSSVGIGVDLIYPCPIPYLSPIGISIGERHRLYGFLEMNLSGASTLALGGVGIRL